MVAFVSHIRSFAVTVEAHGLQRRIRFRDRGDLDRYGEYLCFDNAIALALMAHPLCGRYFQLKNPEDAALIMPEPTIQDAMPSMEEPTVTESAEPVIVDTMPPETKEESNPSDEYLAVYPEVTSSVVAGRILQDEFGVAAKDVANKKLVKSVAAQLKVLFPNLK